MVAMETQVKNPWIYEYHAEHPFSSSVSTCVGLHEA